MSLSSIFNSFGRLSLISRFFLFYNWREPVKTGQHAGAGTAALPTTRVCVYTFDGHHRQRKFEPKKKRKIKSLTKNQKENKTKRKGAKTKGNEKINRRRRRIRKASERAFSEWCTVGDPFRLLLLRCVLATLWHRSKWTVAPNFHLRVACICVADGERGAAETKKKKKDEGGMSVGKTLEKNFPKKRRRRKTCPVSNATMKGPSRLCERREKDFWQKGQQIKGPNL